MAGVYTYMYIALQPAAVWNCRRHSSQSGRVQHASTVTEVGIAHTTIMKHDPMTGAANTQIGGETAATA